MKFQCKPIEINKKFNMLTIIEEVNPVFSENGVKKRMVLCSCDCGKSKVIEYHQILRGRSKSCGCIKKGAKNRGLSSHIRLRNTHMSMKQRCYNKNNPNYKHYSAKGVTICDDWLSFEGFLKDMLDSHVPGLTIDRIDPFGNYCKENCIWIPKSEQGMNKRRNILITFNGITQNVSRWAAEYKIDRSTLHRQLKSGISFERIVKMLPYKFLKI